MTCDRIDDDWMDCDVCPDYDICEKEEKHEWDNAGKKSSSEVK